MFWSPSVHSIINFIHIFSGVFWLGWMVFIFFVLRPVAARISGVDVMTFMVPIRQRVRKFVLWLIPIIILTGLYNMGYQGLLNGHVLAGTGVGNRMIWKLVAAAILFGIYYFAPRILGKGFLQRENAPHPKEDLVEPDVAKNSLLKREDPHPPKASLKAKKVEVILHIIAFSAGCAAAYLGVTIAG
jgi:uncharacterized membrane protein